MDEDPAIRLRLAVDLHEVGVAMRRQQLVRAMPGASATEVDDAPCEWLRVRPGAPHGDTWVPTPPAMTPLEAALIGTSEPCSRWPPRATSSAPPNLAALIPARVRS